MCTKGGGLGIVKPSGCPCAGNCAAIEGSEGWEAVNLGNRIGAAHLERSEVLGLAGLFAKLKLDTGPDFLSCLLLGVHCGFLDATHICRIPFDGSLGSLRGVGTGSE